MANAAKRSLREQFPRRYDIPALIIFCAGLLWVGLSLPLFKVQQLVFWKNEYSVMSGVVGLFSEEEYFLALILFFFSIVFPVIKLSVLWILWTVRFGQEERMKILHWLELLGKWSMLDVFVVAVLIVAVKLGPVAKVEPKMGIYVFCSAILAAMLATKWVQRLATSGLKK